MKTNKIRIVACGILVCAAIAGMLVLFMRGMELSSEKLEAINPKKTGDMETALWVIKHFMYFLPLAIASIIQGICAKIKVSPPHMACKEKYVVSIIAFVFLIVVMAPVCAVLSGAFGDGEQISSLPVEWLMWQLLLFLPMLLYGKIRFDELRASAENQNEDINRE